MQPLPHPMGMGSWQLGNTMRGFPQHNWLDGVHTWPNLANLIFCPRSTELCFRPHQVLRFSLWEPCTGECGRGRQRISGNYNWVKESLKRKVGMRDLVALSAHREEEQPRRSLVWPSHIPCCWGLCILNKSCLRAEMRIFANYTQITITRGN